MNLLCDYFSGHEPNGRSGGAEARQPPSTRFPAAAARDRLPAPLPALPALPAPHKGSALLQPTTGQV